MLMISNDSFRSSTLPANERKKIKALEATASSSKEDPTIDRGLRQLWKRYVERSEQTAELLENTAKKLEQAIRSELWTAGYLESLVQTEEERLRSMPIDSKLTDSC